ncbi:MAG: hypothetical protein ACRENB_08435 [Gemmatimonadales bacterium]
MKTLLDPACHARIVARFRSLDPAAQPRWGALTAPRMLAHLCDQMRHTLGDTIVPGRAGPLRWPLVKQALMYWLPWPKGKIKGPREMFRTPPATWSADLAALEGLVDRFIRETSRDRWPEHPFFGSMTHRSWGRFIHRHFDHHLRQFGA